MKLGCNVIRDLLPLYADQICSEESRGLVEEHLADCKNCSVLLRQMRSEEMESSLETEAVDVIHRQANFFKRKSAVIGAAIAGVFMIPVLVCLIVNLATGAALDWFFIVLASLLTAASLSIVPLMVPDHKGLWTLGTFTASLLLLFGVICIYTGGTWFFLVSATVLFGISVCFLPFAVHAEPVRSLLGSFKGLTVMAVDTLLYVLMMGVIGVYVDASVFWRLAPRISFPCLVLAWFVFLLIRYAKCNGFLKAGLCTALIGVYSFFANYLVNRWIGTESSIPAFHPFIWRVDTIDGNIRWIVLLVGCITGIVLMVYGISVQEKKDI
ncbi:MAG: zf-HC2 domain-containing protein [Lachnospiraceae bacterium]|nr:zf-HC2 domain-containing protein [Lachnospiraceae bacterium]